MVAELLVESTANAAREVRKTRLQLVLELPFTGGGGARQLTVFALGTSTIAALRFRAFDVLGVRDLDAYLTVDGKVVKDENMHLADLASHGSRVRLQPRLRGGCLQRGRQTRPATRVRRPPARSRSPAGSSRRRSR